MERAEVRGVTSPLTGVLGDAGLTGSSVEFILTAFGVTAEDGGDVLMKGGVS